MISSATRILLYIVALSMLLCACDNFTMSEDQTNRFVRYYPTSLFYNEEGYDMAQLPDGGYLVISTTFWAEGDITDGEIMLIMADEFGMEKENTPILIANQGNDFGYRVVSVSDGYVIAGSSKQDPNSFGFIVKVKPSGELVWKYTLGTAPQQEFFGITASNDGGFILTGYIDETGGDRQIYLVKTNSLGLTIWERAIGFTGYNDIGEAVVELNNRIIIAGTTAPLSSSSGNSRLLILNTNSEGKGMTEYRISAEGNLTGSDMVVDDNDNIIILGNHENLTAGLSSLYFAKIKLEGFNNELITVLNATSVDFLESLHGESMVISRDKSLAICGWKGKQPDRDILFAQIDQDFNLKNIQLFGSTGDQSGSGICITTDGGYAFTGGTNIAGKITTTLIKLGPDGKLY